MKWKSKLLSLRDALSDRQNRPEWSVNVSSTAHSTAIVSHERREENVQGDQPSLTTNSAAKRLAKPIRVDEEDSVTNPLGLTVLHAPDRPIADIIFIHGLGGTSQHTWSKNKTSDLFWPKEWLKLEPDIQHARILTFGYNANFLSPGSFANISDFAKSLLSEMKFGKDDELDDLNVGVRPITFVVHSMGGLIFKKAYLQGLHNDEYKDIISQVRAVLFLSSPHRGTNLAEFLNRVLSASIFSHTPKQYINDLVRNSPAIEDINDSFRFYAARFQIFSFYETLETSIGPKRVKIVEKDSSIIGLPNEISIPLNAGHHDVCKFASRNDPNYKSIRSVLKTVISNIIKSEANTSQGLDDMKSVSELLSVSAAPYDDLMSIFNRWRPGTCVSFLSNVKVDEWIQPTTSSCVLWLHGKPACGKSVKSAFLINHMIETGRNCCYYFFIEGDSTRNSMASMLRSFAYQTAEKVKAFRDFLIEFSNKSASIEKMDARILWDRLFVAGLFKLNVKIPFYWIIDALDEAEASNVLLLFGLLSSMTTSGVPVRIYIASRETPNIARGFSRISSELSVEMVAADYNQEDITIYSSMETQMMCGTPEFRRGVLDRIVTNAGGNFLWVYFALEEIKQCYSEEHIEDVMSKLPRGMEAKYQRMEAKIVNLSRASDLVLARMILACALLSRRILSREELLQFLQPESGTVIDVKHTISHLCGEFVSLDDKDRLTLVHQTAREYLLHKAHLPFRFEVDIVQGELFSKTLMVFMDPQLRSKLRNGPLPAFHYYAATSWPHHLRLSCGTLKSTEKLLREFFGSDSVLLWVQILAGKRELEILTAASAAVRLFLDSTRYDMSIHHSDRKDFEYLRKWALDLHKLGGKFGTQLLDCPTAIGDYVPQYCPTNSKIYQQFGSKTQFSITWPQDTDWDDKVTRVSVGPGRKAEKIISSSRHFAILTSSGDILIWDSFNFKDLRYLSNQEYIEHFCFSPEGDLIACSGITAVHVWNVSSGLKVSTINAERALCITFAAESTKLLLATRAGAVHELSINNDVAQAKPVLLLLADQDVSIEGSYPNRPTISSFSDDKLYLAVGYRNFPLTVWKIFSNERPRRCHRRTKLGQFSGYSWSGVTRAIWHPNNEEIFGIYTDGAVFRWNIFKETYDELKESIYNAPSEIQFSASGEVFATADVTGMVKFYSTTHFSLIHQIFLDIIVLGICFSPEDLGFFFTLSNADCDIWELSVSMLQVELDNNRPSQVGDTGTPVVPPSQNAGGTENTNIFTVLSARPNGGLICLGNDNGVLSAQSSSSLSTFYLGKSKSGESIGFISWDNLGNYLAYADYTSYADVTVIKVEEPTEEKSTKVSTRVVAEIPSEDSKINEVLLSQDGRFLLISYPINTRVWSILNKSLCVEICNTSSMHGIGGSYKPIYWLNHPTLDGHLLQFTIDTVTIYTWDKLIVVAKWEIRKPQLVECASLGKNSAQRAEANDLVQDNPSGSSHFRSDPFKHYLEEVFLSQDQKYALLQMSENAIHRTHLSRLDIIPLSALRNFDNNVIDPIMIPEEIQSMILRPLGVLGQNRLVFLSKSYWVWTWRIGVAPDDRSTMRYFFLPRDWLA